MDSAIPQGSHERSDRRRRPEGTRCELDRSSSRTRNRTQKPTVGIGSFRSPRRLSPTSEITVATQTAAGCRGWLSSTPIDQAITDSSALYLVTLLLKPFRLLPTSVSSLLFYAPLPRLALTLTLPFATSDVSASTKCTCSRTAHSPSRATPSPPSSPSQTTSTSISRATTGSRYVPPITIRLRPSTLYAIG
jgi:hypothetical protein